MNSNKSSTLYYRHWAGSSFRKNSELAPIQIEAPIKKILRRLRDRGIISRRRPSRPIHVASLTNVSDGDIVNRSAGIAISPLSYYRCRDNLYQVRTIVDHQIRWSAIFTLAHKHKSSARNIIPKKVPHSKRPLLQSSSHFSAYLLRKKLGPGQDPKKVESEKRRCSSGWVVEPSFTGSERSRRLFGTRKADSITRDDT